MKLAQWKYNRRKINISDYTLQTQQLCCVHAYTSLHTVYVNYASVLPTAVWVWSFGCYCWERFHRLHFILWLLFQLLQIGNQSISMTWKWFYIIMHSTISIATPFYWHGARVLVAYTHTLFTHRNTWTQSVLGWICVLLWCVLSFVDCQKFMHSESVYASTHLFKSNQSLLNTGQTMRLLGLNCFRTGSQPFHGDLYSFLLFFFLIVA